MSDALQGDPPPLRAALESQDRAAVIATLADNVRFRSPSMSEPYDGRQVVGALMNRVAFEIFEDLRFVGELREGSDVVLHFKTRVGDCDAEGVFLIRSDADGRVSEVTTFMRPLAAIQALEVAFGDRMPRTEAGG